MKRTFLLFSILIIGLTVSIAPEAMHHNKAQEIISEMSAAANNFLDGLDDGLREKATFPMQDDERINWHFFPKEREGVMFKELEQHQRLLAHALIQTPLSHKGYWKTNMVMVLEHVLHVIEDYAPRRDAEQYYITIFGEPGVENTWGWRLEGHHLSLNFTLHDGEMISCTPMFFGANPANVQSGPHKGLRVLKEEEDYGRKLVKMLNDNQKEKAIFAEQAPADILTGAKKRVDPMKPKGIKASELNEEQQEMLLKLIHVYVHKLRPELADQDMKNIHEAGMEKLYFAWGGGLNPSQGHYYAVQGPGFIFEYDNTQGGANHIHAVWRDFDGDFGYDVLSEHYKNSEHHN